MDEWKMPSDAQFRLQCGELGAQGLRDAKAGYRMAMAAAKPTRLEQMAIAWWEDKRPLRYTLQDHLANPIVNCIGGSEGDLAIAIADIQARRKRGKENG